MSQPLVPGAQGRNNPHKVAKKCASCNQHFKRDEVTCHRCGACVNCGNFVQDTFGNWCNHCGNEITQPRYDQQPQPTMHFL